MDFRRFDHMDEMEQSAMGDLLGEDYSLVEKNALYRCLDKLLWAARRFRSSMSAAPIHAATASFTFRRIASPI
jgi:hypothetical protein